MCIRDRVCAANLCERWGISWRAGDAQCPFECRYYLNAGHSDWCAPNNEVERRRRRCRQRHSQPLRCSSQGTVGWCAVPCAAYRRERSVREVRSTTSDDSWDLNSDRKLHSDTFTHTLSHVGYLLHNLAPSIRVVRMLVLRSRIVQAVFGSKVV